MANRAAGFTLVETLASLAVVAMLSLMLMAGAQASRRQLSRLESVNSIESIETAQRVLRSSLRQAFPYTQFEGPKPSVAFGGVADSLDFLAPPPAATAPDGLQNYKLRLEPNGELALFWVMDLATNPERSQKRVTLLQGVSSVDLAYFGADPRDGAPHWQNRWQERLSLPKLVRVRVSFPVGDQRLWPELIVRTGTTLDSGCVIDPATHECWGRG